MSSNTIVTPPTPTAPAGVKARPFDLATGSFPLVLTPDTPEMASPAAITAWMAEHRDWLRAEMTRWGAVLLRGFDLVSATDFERALLAVDTELQTFYWGTSPRMRLTDFVFTASELPWFYPIPQHLEMSFLDNPPLRIYFFCMVPAKRWGETPLVDFRAVARDLDPALKEKFASKGIRYIRNYYGPKGGNALDPTDYKRWDDMFQTTDKPTVDRMAAEQHFRTEWKSGDRLALIHEQPAFRNHPLTGEEVWFNHAQVFHVNTGKQELDRTAKAIPHPLTWGLSAFATLLITLKRYTTKPEDQSTHVQFGDGTEISDAEMSHLRDVIWKNMVVFPWKKGDTVLIDNWLVSHGRRPYLGDRMVAVAWS